MKRLFWIGLVVVAVLILVLFARCHRHDSGLPTANLLKNPGADLGPGSSDGNRVASIPEWQITGLFNVVRYGASGYLTSASPGPADRAQNFFVGGPDGEESFARQTVDLTPYSASIASGKAVCTVSGYLGGYAEQADCATFSAEFFDEKNKSLGSSAIGPVTNEERKNVSGLLYREKKIPIPTGAHSVTVTLHMRRYAGTANDGYADSLGLVLSSAEK